MREIAVEPDHVYVIPATENLKIQNGALHTVPRLTESGARNMAIDDFLESLAKDRGNLAFGIVLFYPEPRRMAAWACKP